MKPLRIMFNSNAPWAPSGYGVFMKDFLPKVKDLGHEIAISCFYGLEGAIIKWNGITCYPKLFTPYGSDAILYHSQHFKADVTFSMQDVQTLDPNILKQIPRWITYTPIHYSPPVPLVRDRLKYAYRIVTFSKFGHDGLEKEGFNSKMIYEGLVPDKFPIKDKKLMKKQLGIDPNAFLFGMIGANKEIPTRKGFQEALDAFAMFVKDYPNSYLYAHTYEPPQGALSLLYYAKHLGIESRVKVPTAYQVMIQTPHEKIADIVNAFDVLLEPSRTEGFGLPVIESQAVGVPAIVTNFSALPELIKNKKTGSLVDVMKYDWAAPGGYHAVPDPKSIYKGMLYWHKRLSDEQTRSQTAIDCHENVVNNFNLDKIFKDQWVPFFNQLLDEVSPEEKE